MVTMLMNFIWLNYYNHDCFTYEVWNKIQNLEYFSSFLNSEYNLLYMPFSFMIEGIKVKIKLNNSNIA